MVKGIKETMELLTAIDHLLIALEVALEDGKIDLYDLPRLLPLWSEFYQAAQGLSEIPDEVKDLDAVELQQIAQLSVDIAVQATRMLLGTRAP